MRIVGWVSLVLLGLLLRSRDADAEDWPTQSLDWSVYEADLVVEAEAEVEQALARNVERRREDRPVSFKVLSVLKGREAAPGAVLSVRGLEDYVLVESARGRDGTPGDRPKIRRVLLFLEHSVDQGGLQALRPVMSGVRYLTDAGQVLVPEQQMKPGPYFMVPSGEASWEERLSWTRDDVARVESAWALRRLDDDAARNQAILAWLHKHREALADPYRGRFRGGDAPGGIGGVGLAAVRWVMETCVPADAWAALTLLNTASRRDRRPDEPWMRPEPDGPTFQSREGRTFLIGVARDDSRPVAERLLALHLLPLHHTQGGYHAPLRPGLSLATLNEVEEQVRALQSLASAPAPVGDVAAAATRVLAGRDLPRRTRKPREELLAIYRKPSVGESENVNRLGYVRDLATVLDEGEWQALTGNPRGILVTFYLFEPDSAGGRLQISGDRLPLPVFEKPTLVLERLADDRSVLETRRLALPFRGVEPSWEKGWNGGGEARFPTRDLAAGLWRVTIEGRAGGGGLPWRSEASSFRWPSSGR